MSCFNRSSLPVTEGLRIFTNSKNLTTIVWAEHLEAIQPLVTQRLLESSVSVLLILLDFEQAVGSMQ